LSGTITGTYTLGGTPTFPASVATLTGAQTLTNKVLTSPTINTPTITNASITADAISGFSSANSGTIFGMAVSSGVLGSNTVPTAAYQSASITGPKVNWAATGASAGIWWEEISRVTLGVAGDSIDTGTIAARKYLQLRITLIASGSIDTRLRFNNDSATNYAYRYNSNGTLSSNTSIAGIGLNTGNTGILEVVVDILNIATQRKVVHSSSAEDVATGAGTAPSYLDTWGKWDNASAAITRITLAQISTGDYAAGSELVVLGHD
jgi:hypothetical protein